MAIVRNFVVEMVCDRCDKKVERTSEKFDSISAAMVRPRGWKRCYTNNNEYLLCTRCAIALQTFIEGE